MKTILIIFIIVSLFSCTKQLKNEDIKTEKETVFIRIEAVDKDGESNFSKIIILNKN